MPAVAERSIRIVISKDRVRAHLALAGVNPASLTEESFLAALGENHISVTPELRSRLQQILADCRAGQVPAEPVLLIEGRAPTQGQGAVFELAPELADTTPVTDETDADARADFHRSHIITVKVDTCIGTLHPAVPPVPGIDICGKPIEPSSRPRSMELGENVRLGDDGQSVFATLAGKVHLTRNEVGVVEVVEIAEDVDFSTGNVEAPTNVLINGTVRDSFRVTSTGNITVRGAIEAAEIEAATDVQVNGGIASRGGGRVFARREVFTKFCNEANVEAIGDITITRESMGSRLHTLGQLHIARGSLIGGFAYAREGADIRDLGNEANIKTEIAIGVEPKALLQAAQVDEQLRKKREAVAKIRQAVQPLMAQLKRLTPAQRERATELMYQADSMEAEIEQARREVTDNLKAHSPTTKEPVLLVQHMIYPNVTAIFGDKVTVFHKERKGPFKIVCRVHNRVQEILLIDKISGSITVLGSRSYEPPAA